MAQGRRYSRAMVVAAACVLMSSPVAASAATGLISYEGSDYSYDWNSITQVMVCDQESDSNGVHADYLVIGSGTNQQVRDGDGGRNACASTGVYSQKIYRHRAVEEVPLAPDQFGSWKYPY